MAADGVEALARVEARSYDLMLLDVEMPGLNGFDVLTRIRATRSHTAPPVIMVTARTQGAHSLDMDDDRQPASRRACVAEGVETGDQLEQLRTLGCEFAQGFYFSTAVDGEAAGQLITNQPWLVRCQVSGIREQEGIRQQGSGGSR